MDDFAKWVLDLVKELFGPVWDFLTDFIIATLEALLAVVVALLNAIPGFDSLSGGMQQFYGSLPSGVAYCLDQMGFPAALALIGTGFAFRLGRKVVTLFQW
jgi:hypothetical protein